jgi:hypothetical protein
MLSNPIFRSALGAVVLMLSLSACAGRQPIETHAALGKVVVYRNGVAYFERRAVVSDGQLKLTVPVDRVDDFLKSLQVVDAKTKQSLPISFDTMNTGSDEAQMIIAVPGNQSRELLVSYVTDSPAWKPSYRIVLEPKDGKAELEAWAVVDNVSGEDWKQVTVGVGSTSALSFRYDLHSIREVQRETLGDENAYAMAGPMGGSPYAVAGDEAPVIGGLDNSMFDHMGELGELAAAAPAPMEESDAMYREEGLLSQGTSGSGRGAGVVSKPKGKRADHGGATLHARSSAARAPADDGMALQRLATEINKREGKVQIQGFARSGDGDPQNDARMRAERVRDQLVQLGVPAEKVEAEASGLVSDSQAVRVVTKDSESKPSQSSTAEGSRTETIGNAYFVSGVPMTIEKDRSAMVSLLKSKAKAQRVYYYDPVSPRGSSTYAFQAVRMDNPSDQTLDRGPFTVYAEGQFLGEGLSDAIPPRGTAFVPYALDRQVVVDTKTKGTEEVHQLLAIERGVVHAEVHQIHETTFALHNRGEKPAKVYVRYAVAPGWELRAGDHKVERLGQDYLIAVDVPAHKNAELVVAQAQPAERSIDMRLSAGAASVEAYLKRTKAITAELRGQLEAVLALYREMGDIEERKTTIAEQMVEYRTRVDEINMQLVTLRNVKTAGALSAHLAKKMREISERLQQATIKSTDLQGELMACRIRMQDQLAELKLERASEKDKAIAAK